MVSAQERGIRSGTVPAPLAVGLGAACEVAREEMAADTRHVRKLAHRLYDGITSQLEEVTLNGPGDLDGADRYIGNLNLSFAYVEGESLIMGLKVWALRHRIRCLLALLLGLGQCLCLHGRLGPRPALKMGLSCFCT